MTFTRDDFKKLALPLLACFTLLLCGLVLIKLAGSALHQANQVLAAAKAVGMRRERVRVIGGFSLRAL